MQAREISRQQESLEPFAVLLLKQACQLECPHTMCAFGRRITLASGTAEDVNIRMRIHRTVGIRLNAFGTYAVLVLQPVSRFSYAQRTFVHLIADEHLTSRSLSHARDVCPHALSHGMSSCALAWLVGRFRMAFHCAFERSHKLLLAKPVVREHFLLSWYEYLRSLRNDKNFTMNNRLMWVRVKSRSSCTIVTATRAIASNS